MIMLLLLELIQAVIDRLLLCINIVERLLNVTFHRLGVALPLASRTASKNSSASNVTAKFFIYVFKLLFFWKGIEKLTKTPFRWRS